MLSSLFKYPTYTSAYKFVNFGFIQTIVFDRIQIENYSQASFIKKTQQKL